MAAGVPPEPRVVKELDFKVIKEEWLTIKLKDGSIIKFKPVLMKVFETDRKDPATDEPIISCDGHNVVTVRSPEDLRRNPSEYIPSPDEALKMPKEEVEVIETTDPGWNVYELETGKRIRSKPVITNVYRIKDVFDRYGNPYYIVRSQMVVSRSSLWLQSFIGLSAEGVREKWPPLPTFQDERGLKWEFPFIPPKLVETSPTALMMPALRDRWIEKQQFASIEMFLGDIHKIIKGRLKDWKEEEHLADKLLFRLAKREE